MRCVSEGVRGSYVFFLLRLACRVWWFVREHVERVRSHTTRGMALRP